MKAHHLNKKIISANDYEKYVVHLPFSVVFSRYRKKYILSELEKLHPRFSSRCCVDTKFTLQKNNIKANLFVMDKSRLSEYRLMYPNKNLFINDDKETLSVFKNHQDQIKTLLLLIFVAFLIALIPFLLFQNKERQKNEKVLPVESVKKDFFTAKQVLSKFYETLKNEKVEVESFKFSLSENFIEINAQLSKGSPEKMYQNLKKVFNKNIVLSSVQYEKNIPLYSISVRSECFQKVRKTEIPIEMISNFRSVIKKNDSELLSESFLPYSADILCKNNSVYNVFSAINEIAQKNHVGISRVDINKGSFGKNRVHLVFEDTENILSDIALCSSLLQQTFVPESKIQIPQIKTNSNEVKNQLELIGEIVCEDGTRNLFYKNKLGEIISTKNKSNLEKK